MKKTILLFILCCTVLAAVTGCDNRTKYGSDSTVDQESVSAFPDYVYEPEKAQRQSVSRMAISPGGYYYTASHTLYFYDIENDLNTAMCSEAGCTHNKAGCAAYVYPSGEVSKSIECNCDENEIFFYNDKIYMFEINEERDSFLCQYDRNFNNRERVARVASLSEEGASFCSSLSSIIYKGYMYYCTELQDPQDVNLYTYNCMRVKLEAGAVPEKLGQFEFQNQWGRQVNVLVSGEDIYYIGCSIEWKYPHTGEVEITEVTGVDAQYRIARYSEESGDFNTIWSYTGDEATDVWGSGTDVIDSVGSSKVCMDTDGNLYMLSSVGADWKDRGIIKVNFKDKTGKKIYSTERRIVQIACDGDKLYILEYDDNPHISVLDKEGKRINEFKIEYSDEYEERYKQIVEHMGPSQTKASGGIVLYGVDDRYILVGTAVNAYEGLMTAGVKPGYEYFGPGFGERIMCGIGVIDKAEFLAGEKVEIKQIYEYGN